LHVLGTPPAFILSQDQTLRIIFITISGVSFLRWYFSTGLFLLPITLQLLKFRFGGFILPDTPPLVKLFPATPQFLVLGEKLPMHHFFRSLHRPLASTVSLWLGLKDLYFVVLIAYFSISFLLRGLYFTTFLYPVKGFPRSFLDLFFLPSTTTPFPFLTARLDYNPSGCSVKEAMLFVISGSGAA
jgi:hypothetical protein